VCDSARQAVTHPELLNRLRFSLTIEDHRDGSATQAN